MQLAEFLKTQDGQKFSRAEWARRFNVTRGYLTLIASGSRVPSLALAIYIEKATDGMVPANEWPCSWKTDADDIDKRLQGNGPSSIAAADP